MKQFRPPSLPRRPARDRFDDMEPTEKIRFFVPGPSYVPAAVREAMTHPSIGHRSAAFRELYAAVARRLPEVFRTRGDVYVVTGSATLVMESALVSLVERRVLHLVCGAFSKRWLDIGRALGRESDRLEVPWGRSFDPDVVREALERKHYEAVTIVHNETSTGVINPLAELAAAVREASDALVLVDAVSSLGGAPVEPDGWGLDLVLTGAQKALALPPGLAFFTLSERAVARAEAIAHRGFYTDLLRYRAKHRKHGTISTPAIPQFYALDRQLDGILAEGMEARWERHRRLQARTERWAAERGLAFASAEGSRSPTVSCLEPPAGMAGPELVSRLAERGFTLGGGYGDWKPKTFRIGHMGEVGDDDLEELLAAIDAALA